jgi:hypothetical protein
MLALFCTLKRTIRWDHLRNGRLIVEKEEQPREVRFSFVGTAKELQEDGQDWQG